MKITSLVSSIIILWLTSANCLSASKLIHRHNIVDQYDKYKNAVSIVPKDSYYAVTLDYTKCPNPYVIGYVYGKKIVKEIPNFEELLDSYMNNIIDGNKLIYKIMLVRARNIKVNVEPKYIAEIKGMAKALNHKINRMGDRKITCDELIALNLIPDIGRLTQCSALAAFGQKTKDNHMLVGRNLDWPCGDNYELAKIQAVITIKYPHSTITSIGIVGYNGAITMLNNSGVFAAILDSPNLYKYSSINKNSYPFDLRQALETNSTADTVANFMLNKKRHYTVGHLILIADKSVAGIVENNTKKLKNKDTRVFRTSEFTLHDGLEWSSQDTIACVNCFASINNQDNRKNFLTSYNLFVNKNKNTIDDNTKRWKNLNSLLNNNSKILDIADIKKILGYYHGIKPDYAASGDIYNRFTFQSIVFCPNTLNLLVSFHPKDTDIPDKPKFEQIDIK